MRASGTFKGRHRSGTARAEAPLRQVASLPPTAIVTAGHDPNLDEGKLFAEKLWQSGVRVSATHFPSAFHGFMPFGVLDVAGDSVQALAKAIAEQ